MAKVLETSSGYTRSLELRLGELVSNSQSLGQTALRVGLS